MIFYRLQKCHTEVYMNNDVISWRENEMELNNLISVCPIIAYLMTQFLVVALFH